MRSTLLVLISFCFILAACSDDKLNVDVSDVQVAIEFDRFEKALFEADSEAQIAEINQNLIDRGGELYEFYVYDMLRSGSVYDDSIGTYLWYFVTDSIMKKTVDDIETTFSDFDAVENQIIDLFKHQKYHLPESPLPTKIITYNSAFNYGVISTDSAIGIGLEMYLGTENRIVQELPFPVYVKEKMKSDYLPVDVAQSWLATNVIEQDKGETFLSSLIYYGKLKYAMQALLPDLKKHKIMRYSADEYEYALASEYNIWQYLVDMNWIYSIEMKVKLRFFEESPTTVGIEGSPGRIGRFMGWQMVSAYMEKYPEVTVKELLAEKNESKILKAYKPEPNE